MTATEASRFVRMRVVVVDPPQGVRFAVQRGRSQLLEAMVLRPNEIWFEFQLRLGAPLADGSANFLGEFAHGRPADRFVYLNSGTQAGQADSRWSRRAKLKLAFIPEPLVEGARSSAGAIVEARIAGTLRDGGPICASLEPGAIQWSLVRET